MCVRLPGFDTNAMIYESDPTTNTYTKKHEVRRPLTVRISATGTCQVTLLTLQGSRHVLYSAPNAMCVAQLHRSLAFLGLLGARGVLLAN